MKCALTQKRCDTARPSRALLLSQLPGSQSALPAGCSSTRASAAAGLTLDAAVRVWEVSCELERFDG
jgi:hypothetical protein